MLKMINNENEHSWLDLNSGKNLMKAGKFDDEFLNDSKSYISLDNHFKTEILKISYLKYKNYLYWKW